MKYNNLKDTENYGGPIVKDIPIPISYNKTYKLITALYMVTDIIDINEPIRNKLRTLGAEIISDTYILPSNSLVKISQIMSFLDIASAVNIISSMNCSILRKEFLELSESIKLLNSDLSEFFRTDLANSLGRSSLNLINFNENKSIRQDNKSTRIGVQKGGTLMKALSDKTLARSFGGSTMSNNNKIDKNSNFDILKKERREEILSTIARINNLEGITITDIINKGQGIIASCSEKTVQRELISMLKDGVLYKTGEKRWSKYFIKN